MGLFFYSLSEIDKEAADLALKHLTDEELIETLGATVKRARYYSKSGTIYLAKKDSGHIKA